MHLDGAASKAQVKAFDLGNKQFRNDIEDNRIKLILYFSVTMSTVEEVFPLPDFLENKKAICGKNASNSERLSPAKTKDCIHMESTSCTLLYGGYTDGNDLADQLCHCDIPATTTDGKLVSLSTCNKFTDLCKPHILIIPLTEKGREIYFLSSLMEKIRIKVNYGEALIYFGDTPHGGITYAKSGNKPPLHACLQFYMISNHYTFEKKDESYYPEVTVMNEPALLRHLQPKHQISGLKRMLDNICDAAEACATTESNNKQLMRLLAKKHKQLGTILNKYNADNN